MERIFHGENGANLSDFEGKNKSKLPYFYDKFQTIAENIEGFFFLKNLLSYLIP
jgi:hypothetical protein